MNVSRQQHKNEKLPSIQRFKQFWIQTISHSKSVPERFFLKLILKKVIKPQQKHEKLSSMQRGNEGCSGHFVVFFGGGKTGSIKHRAKKLAVFRVSRPYLEKCPYPRLFSLDQEKLVRFDFNTFW